MRERLGEEMKVGRLRKKDFRKGKGIAQTEGKVFRTEEIKDTNELC